MKKFFSILLIAVAATVLLASCTKRDYNNRYNEDGIVVYHENSPWIIVSFNDGDYAVMKAVESNSDYWPITNDILRGNFQYTGTRSYNNVTAGYYFNGWIVSFESNYSAAKSDLDYYATQDGYALSKADGVKTSIRTRVTTVK
jgi:hypothetical protein